MSINQVAISGNLTRDAEQRTSAGGTVIVGFSVAVNERRKNQQTGEWEDYPNFVDCTMFGNYAAALYPHLVKGAKVAVGGKLRFSQWEKDGQKRSKLEVIAQEVEVMRQAEAQPQQYVQTVAPANHSVSTVPSQSVVQAVQQATAQPLYAEDIPF